MKPFASWIVVDTAPMKDSMPAQFAKLCITMPVRYGSQKTTDVIFSTFKAEDFHVFFQE